MAVINGLLLVVWIVLMFASWPIGLAFLVLVVWPFSLIREEVDFRINRINSAKSALWEK